MTTSESIPKLTSEGTNFLIWKKKLYSVLSAKNIAYILTTNPDINDENDDKEWDHDDLTCRDIIDKSIDNNLSIMYQDRHTARCLMDALTVHFKTTLSRQIALHREYFHHKMSVHCSIGCHITKMGAAAAELEAAGVEVPEMMKVVTLIDSLPKLWRDAVLSRTDLEEDLTVEVVIERLRSIGDMRALDLNYRDISMAQALDLNYRDISMAQALDRNKRDKSMALIGIMGVYFAALYLVFKRR